MRAVKLTWMSVALLLPSLAVWGAEICHTSSRTLESFSKVDPNTGWFFFRTVVQQDVITLDIQKVSEEISPREGFTAYMHPWGELRTTTTTRSPREQSVHRTDVAGPMFEDCCTCGNNENAAYQLKIYSRDQDPRTQKFDKPILVVQGFDANYKILGRQFNFGEFQSRLDDLVDETTGVRLIGLLRELYEAGYDIALLLWKNPLIEIETNAWVTLQALRWLDDHTDIREGTEPVVIGPSMGGLVTRYALQLAGGDFPASGIRARLFIAFDSPNRGAEVPMSLQALVSFGRDRSDTQRRIFWNLTSPAARQLLLSSVVDQKTGTVNQVITDYENPSDSGNPTARAHAEFMREINDPDFRAQIKKIVHRFGGREEFIYTAAIINGSGTGWPLGYPQGHIYASLKSPLLIWDVVELATARAGRPFGVGRAKESATIAGGSGDSLQYNFQEPAFVENAPGGLRDTYRITIEELQKLGVPFVKVDPGFTNHAFIPSISGAGLLDSDINNNAPWFTGIGTEGKCVVGPTCMFDEFRAPERNQQHVQVTPENKRWFLELIGTYGPRAVVEARAGIACELDQNPPFPMLSRLRARFGYNNPNAFDVIIPIGENNRFTGHGIQKDEGQPKRFQSGQHSGAFQVIFGGLSGRGVPAWTLDGTTVEPSLPDPLRPNPCRPAFGE